MGPSQVSKTQAQVLPVLSALAATVPRLWVAEKICPRFTGQYAEDIGSRSVGIHTPGGAGMEGTFLRSVEAYVSPHWDLWTWYLLGLVLELEDMDASQEHSVGDALVLWTVEVTLLRFHRVSREVLELGHLWPYSQSYRTQM
jgi:hypothetical protein